MPRPNSPAPQNHPAAQANAPQKPRLAGKLARILLSYGVAGVCLYWVFHNLDFRQMFHSFAGVNWWWVPAAMVLQLFVYVVAGWEWQVLLRPIGRLSVAQTTQAVFAGRFANDVLPVHVGYVIRIYLVSRWTGASIAAVTPSLLIERLFDGFWLALGIGLTAFFLPLPSALVRAAEIWVGIIVFGLVTGAIILLCKPSRQGSQTSHAASGKGFRKFRAMLSQGLEQIRLIGHSRLLPAGFALSLLKFAVQCLAFLCLLRTYHFQLPLSAQMAVFLVAYVGLSMPSTPASVGVFQLFCIAGLEIFHVPKPVAAGFSWLAFVVINLPLSLAGFIALAQSGLTLRQVRTQIRQHHQRPFNGSETV
ncbi:MAG TPA: lysylphosphatidylglycerol synthase transmembrane domain-containing protein [Candidatus Angelobacter sp.]|nr:lysylphosphatidylglycerol synthase transmembrane domain-containing protein [Candidatus Angelobacter sp.]